MRRETITGLIVLALIVSAFGATVFILNSTLYSASGYARSYLDALARRDAVGALEIVGPLAAGNPAASRTSHELLVPAAMGELADIKFTGETTDGGVRRVTFSYRAGNQVGHSEFAVVHVGAVLGLFNTWRFAVSPLSVIELTVRNDDRATVNAVAVTTTAPGTASPYLAFTPGNYAIALHTAWLEDPGFSLTVSQPGGTVPARLNARANPTFLNAVAGQLKGYLDGCATQTALLPTGCPFGVEITNRIASSPNWSIVSYPKVVITPSDTPGHWSMVRAPGIAHVVVEVKSLFDGSVSRFSSDIPFALSYAIEFLPTGGLVLTPQ